MNTFREIAGRGQRPSAAAVAGWLGDAKARATWPTLAEPPQNLTVLRPDSDPNWGDWSGVLGGDIPLLTAAHESYAAIYRHQVWVHVVVNKLTRGIGRLPLKAYQRDAQNNRARLRAGALPTLLSRPEYRVTPSAFKQRIMGDMCIYGNALVLKVAGSERAVPTELLHVSPVGWAINRNGDYEHTDPRTGARKVFPRWRMLHFRHWSPEDGNGFAVSPLEPLRESIAIEDAAKRMGRSAFANNATPRGGLSTDQELTDEEVARLRAQFAAHHVGPDKAFKPLILTSNLKWQPFAYNLNDSAVVQHRQLHQYDVCAIYDVPPPAVGILDRATFSNITEQGRWLVQHTYNVWTTLIEETIAAQLLDGVPAFEGQLAEFDFGEVLKGATQERFAAYAQALGAGIFTQNEIRRLENYPEHDDPDADLLHRPLNLSPAPEMSLRDGVPNVGA